MPGPDGHVVRQNKHQQLLIKALEHTQARHERLIETRQKVGLPVKPQSLAYLEARQGMIDDIKQKFLKKAGITPAPENKSGSPQRETGKIKEKFNDLSM